jgi:probable HAF family extracellular repeat protein
MVHGFGIGLATHLRSAKCAQQYKVTDLGTLPGDSVSKGYALNDAGEAAGVAETPTAAIATLFSGGKAMSISTLGSSVSVANAINATGEIAGYLTNSNFHAFLYSRGKMRDLGPPGALQAAAVAINNFGQIIGGYYLTSGATGEFLVTNGKLTTLPVPEGASAVSAFAINDNGEIVGTIFFSSGAPPHAAKFANGIWTDLGAISGASASRATGINISGQIVGTAFFPQIQYHPPKPGKHVPFISTTGGLVNLNTLIPPSTGFTLTTDAVAINDSGQILCDATNAAGKEHAVLLTPKQKEDVSKVSNLVSSSCAARVGTPTLTL